MILVQYVFNFHFLSAYTVGFIPVYFGIAYFSGLKANLGNAFEFTPTAGSILLAESHDVTDPSANSNRHETRGQSLNCELS